MTENQETAGSALLDALDDAVSSEDALDDAVSSGDALGDDGPDEDVQPDETLFHSEPWRQAIEHAFELKILEFSPTSEPDGSAFYSTLSDVRGERVVCTPFSDFCDPTLTTAAGWQEFVDHLRSFQRPVTIRPFRNSLAVEDSTFERRRELLWHGIDLSQGAEKVWDGLKSKNRTAIRRAEKQGISFRWSSSIEDLQTLHDMHVDLRKSKYQMLAQPFSLFEALHDRFEDDMAVVLAEDADGDPVAAMCYFAWNGVWYYKFSASYPRQYRPNAAMIMAACREGEERGLTLLDMGRSDVDQPGLVEFKQTFATEELALTTLHWDPEEYNDPAGAEVGKTMGALTELLTDPDVPNHISAKAGDLLYKYFG